MSTQNVQRPIGQAGRCRRMRQIAVAQRIQLGRLDDTGICRCQCRRNAARCHLQRIVPWDDLCRDAKWFIDGEIEIVAPKWNRPALNSFRLIAVIFEIAGRTLDLNHGFPIGLARFQRQQLGNLGAMRQQVIAHPADHA